MYIHKILEFVVDLDEVSPNNKLSRKYCNKLLTFVMQQSKLFTTKRNQ